MNPQTRAGAGAGASGANPASRLTGHRWIAADEDDQCLRCGVTLPHTGVDILPTSCPGNDVGRPHVLADGPHGTLECGYCTLTITLTTTYQQIRWECPGEQPTP